MFTNSPIIYPLFVSPKKYVNNIYYYICLLFSFKELISFCASIVDLSFFKYLGVNKQLSATILKYSVTSTELTSSKTPALAFWSKNTENLWKTSGRTLTVLSILWFLFWKRNLTLLSFNKTTKSFLSKSKLSFHLMKTLICLTLPYFCCLLSNWKQLLNRQ